MCAISTLLHNIVVAGSSCWRGGSGRCGPSSDGSWTTPSCSGQDLEDMTVIIMINFVFSVSFHDGRVMINYPWDDR